MNVARELAPEFENEIANASSVIIGTHLNPDGDALGCALAVSLYLDALHIENEVLCHHEPPKNLAFLPKSDRVKQAGSRSEYDLGVIVDLDPLERLGRTGPYFQTCRRLMVIDHHIPHDKPGDVRIIDTEAPATAVILTHLLMELGADITPDIATCLLAGIVTDTGSFRFRNTTPDSLSLSAVLLEKGGDLIRITEEVFQNKPLSAAKLQGHVLETMKLDCDGRLAWASLSYDDFIRCGAVGEDTEGLVNEMLFVTSVEIAYLLSEPKAGKVRVSIRSRGELDVAAVAREFGGGGHKNAAGCVFELPIQEVEDRLTRRLKLCLASS